MIHFDLIHSDIWHWYFFLCSLIAFSILRNNGISGKIFRNTIFLKII